jgi:hypothetical protein
VSKVYFGLSRLVSSPRVPGDPVPGRLGSAGAASTGPVTFGAGAGAATGSA